MTGEEKSVLERRFWSRSALGQKAKLSRQLLNRRAVAFATDRKGVAEAQLSAEQLQPIRQTQNSFVDGARLAGLAIPFGGDVQSHGNDFRVNRGFGSTVFLKSARLGISIPRAAPSW